MWTFVDWKIFNKSRYSIYESSLKRLTFEKEKTTFSYNFIKSL